MSESDVSCQRGSKETFFGFVETTKDALLLFQAVHRGRLPIVERRFTETEKQAIRPGSIFIFNERDSGIKRWTDGITWSPSRIEANFLRYQELAEKIPPSQKHEYFIPPCESDTTGLSAAVALDDELDDALKGFTSNARRDSKVFPSERLAEYHRSLNNDHPGLETGYIHGQKLLPHHPNTHVYIGSKGIFYIKKGGLVKKTFSLKVNGSTEHLVCYFTEAAKNHPIHPLPRPSNVFTVASLEFELSVFQNQSFRRMVRPTIDDSGKVVDIIDAVDEASNGRRSTVMPPYEPLNPLHGIVAGALDSQLFAPGGPTTQLLTAGQPYDESMLNPGYSSQWTATPGLVGSAPLHYSVSPSRQHPMPSAYAAPVDNGGGGDALPLPLYPPGSALPSPISPTDPARLAWPISQPMDPGILGTGQLLTSSGQPQLPDAELNYFFQPWNTYSVYGQSGMVPHTYDGGQDARDQDMPAPTQALATQALSVQSLIDGTPLTEHDYTDQPLPSALPPIGDSMPRPATSPAWEQCGEADYLPASSAYQPSATGSAMTSGSPTVKRSVHYKYNMTAQTNGSNGYRSGYHSYMPQQLYDEEQLAQYTVSMDPAAAPGQHPNYAAVPEERRHPHLVPGSWYYDSAEDNGLVGCEEMASTQLAETQPPWPHQAFDPITHTFHLTTKRSPSVDDSAAPSPKRVRVETMTP